MKWKTLRKSKDGENSPKFNFLGERESSSREKFMFFWSCSLTSAGGESESRGCKQRRWRWFYFFWFLVNFLQFHFSVFSICNLFSKFGVELNYQKVCARSRVTLYYHSTLMVGTFYATRRCDICNVPCLASWERVRGVVANGKKILNYLHREWDFHPQLPETHFHIPWTNARFYVFVYFPKKYFMFSFVEFLGEGEKEEKVEFQW